MAGARHPLGRWQPWRPREVAAFFATLPIPWWIAGGWAIDLFLGRQTRPHKDIDILILRQDCQAVRSLVRAWDVQAALPPPRDETWPFLPWHLDEELDETIQLMLADSQDDQWLFRRMPSIHRSLATIGDITPEGIPYLVPEIQLLYKGKGLRPKDEADFRHTVPVLRGEQRAWLREALLQVHPQHPWLDHLTAG